jgi:hypothetical protein
VLSVGPARTLLFKGRPVRRLVQGNNSLDLAAPYRIGAADAVLVANNGGTACPTLYYFVTVTAAGAKATPAFGACANLTRVDRTGDTLLVRMSGFLGPFEPTGQDPRVPRAPRVRLPRRRGHRDRQARQVRRAITPRD